MRGADRQRILVPVALTLVVLAGGFLGAQETSSSIRDGVFTSDQAVRGAQRFERICSSCHTPNEMTGRKFAVKWEGMSLGELYEIVYSTMPASAPGSLTAEEYSSVLAFFLRESGYPEGQQELPADAAELKKIRIEPLEK
jgi:mono/diheme cytochrome c family protein